MRQSKYITIITMACALFFASCSDEYMENMNTVLTDGCIYNNK